MSDYLPTHPTGFLRFEFDPMPDVPFALRYDWKATTEGVQAGLAHQSTEWSEIVAATWEEAVEKVRTIVKQTPAERFDKSRPHHLQGCVLVENKPYPFRMLAFRP